MNQLLNKDEYMTSLLINDSLCAILRHLYIIVPDIPYNLLSSSESLAI
jgi:hypothetical protein